MAAAAGRRRLPHRRRRPTHAPSFPVQSFDNGRGIVVNVPQSWKESKPKSGSYVDFLDGNTTRKIRINVEASGNDPKQFLGVAEHGLERGSTCKDYQRVALTDTTLDGHTAAQLEYTCGSGAFRTARHLGRDDHRRQGVRVLPHRAGRRFHGE